MNSLSTVRARCRAPECNRLSLTKPGAKREVSLGASFRAVRSLVFGATMRANGGAATNRQRSILPKRQTCAKLREGLPGRLYRVLKFVRWALERRRRGSLRSCLLKGKCSQSHRGGQMAQSGEARQSLRRAAHGQAAEPPQVAGFSSYLGSYLVEKEISEVQTLCPEACSESCGGIGTAKRETGIASAPTRLGHAGALHDKQEPGVRSQESPISLAA